LSFDETFEIVTSANGFYTDDPDTEANEVLSAVSISASDTLVCNTLNEAATFSVFPEGGYVMGDGITDTTFDATGLTAGTYDFIYFYGPLTDTVSIVVENCVSIDELEAMGGINSTIYPNPVRSLASIRYEVMEAGPTTVEIFDIEGKVIKSMEMDHMGAGLNMVNFDATGHPNGIYSYRISTNQMSQSGQFVIAH